MEEGKEQNSREQRDEIFSRAVRAGKRTYFFDVKTTRGKDLYLTITESKKKFSEEGKFFYEKHKLFLYKEDFEKFEQGFNECIQKIAELRKTDEYNRPDGGGSSDHSNEKPAAEQTDKTLEPVEDANTKEDSFTDVSFDDLGNSDS